MAQRSNFIVRGGYDASSITKGLAKTQAQLGSFQKAVSSSMKFVSAALGSIAVGKLIKDSVKAAMTVESSINNISRTMGSSAAAFNYWAQTQAKSFGMARSEAFKYGAVYSNLISGFTKDTAETEKYTEQLLKASAVIASKTGRTIDDVSERIRSGLLGNTEAIEDVGIYAQVAMLKSTDAFKKIADGRTWEQLTYYEQQQIRIMSVLEQANIKYGDSLAGTTATKQQMFIATLKNIQLNLGQAFLPIYNFILPALTAFASKIESITASFAAFTAALFGKSIQYQVSSTTAGINNQTDAVSGLGDAAEKAGKQVQKSLAPFDELKQVQVGASGSGGSSGGGSGGSSGGGGGGSTTKITPIETTVDSSVAKAIENLKKAIEPTVKALDRLKRALKPVGEFVATGLKSFYEDVLVPIGKWILGKGLPALLDVLSGLIESVNWKKLTEAVVSFNKAIAPFAIAVGTGLINFIQQLAKILTPAVSGAVDLFANGLKLLAKAINLIPKEVAIALGGAIGGIVTAILAFKAANAVIDIIKNIGTSLSNTLGMIAKHPVLAIAAGIAAIAGAALALDKARFDSSALGKFVLKIDEAVQNSKAFNDEVDEMLKKSKEKQKDIEAEYGAISILAKKYFDLADKASLTNEQQALLKAYAKDLIGKIPELSKYIDEQTGAYKGTKEQIQGLIEKTKEYYLVQAAQEDLIEIAKKQYEAEKNLRDLQQKRKEVLDIIKQKQDDYNKALETGASRSSAVTQQQKEQALKTIELSGQISNLKGKLGELDGQIGTTKKSQGELNTSWNYATSYIATYSGSAQTNLQGVQNAVQNTSKTVKNSNLPNEVNKMIAESNKKFSDNTSTQTAVQKWLNSIKNEMSKFKLPDLRVGIKLDDSGLNDINVHGKGVTQVISKYATGGFPDSGELFVANEAGPELIGKFGNQSAVANSNQITDGITNAIIKVFNESTLYSAFVRALNNSEMRAVLDSDSTFNGMRSKSKEYKKRTGQPAF